MARAKVDWINIRGQEGNYEVDVAFKGGVKTKTFTLWTWKDFDGDVEDMPYICPRECEEVYLNDLVGQDELHGIEMTIRNEGYVWVYSNHLEGQEL